MAAFTSALRGGLLMSAVFLFVAPAMAAGDASIVEPAKASKDISCLQDPAKMKEKDLQAFMASPLAMLSENPAGGLRLSNKVRQIAGSSSLALVKIRDLVGTANEPQKAAIAAGLARVVYVCALVGGDEALNYGAEIQALVAGFGDMNFINAFQQASNDIQVAAIGPGTAVVPNGAGAIDQGTGLENSYNNYRTPGDSPRDTTSASYTIGNVDTYVSDVNTTSPSGSN